MVLEPYLNHGGGPPLSVGSYVPTRESISIPKALANVRTTMTLGFSNLARWIRLIALTGTSGGNVRYHPAAKSPSKQPQMAPRLPMVS
jgi:hypothetical protein